MTVDLSKGRNFDLQFDRLVNLYGLREAIQTWEAWDKEDQFKEGLLGFWLDGMTYKAIGGLINARPQEVSKLLKPIREAYFIRCKANVKKIEAILKRKDPEYDYMVYQKTVVNELCALLMGGDKIKNVLVQLTNLGETK